MPEPRSSSRRGVRLSASQRQALQGLTGRARREEAARQGIRAGVGNTDFRGRTPRTTINRSRRRTVAGTGIGGRPTRAQTSGGLTRAVVRSARRQN